MPQDEIALTGLGGSVCLVTGAAGGIGAEIARRLSEAGAVLAITDSDGERIARLGRELGLPDAIQHQNLNVTDGAAVEDCITSIESSLGPIERFVHVAGIQRLGFLVDYSEADFVATFDVNVRGAFNVAKAVGKRMMARKRGAIVAIASNASRVPRVKQGAYCASKAALTHLIRVLALELGPHGVRVNSVSPGATETAMIQRMMSGMGFADELLRGSLENFRVGTPLGKNAGVRDVADAVAFLLSEQASHITMQELIVDGGASLGA